MMRFLRLPVLAAITLTALPAQRPAAVTALVQFPTGVLTLNEPLLDALLAEPAVLEALGTVVPELAEASPLLIARDLVLHPGGTCQLTLQLRTAKALPDGAAPRALRALGDQLQARLEDLLRDHREQLAWRRKELAERLQQREQDRAEVEVRLEAARRGRDAAAARALALGEELAAIEVTIVAEERTAELLAKLRADQEMARADATAHRTESAQVVDRLEAQMQELAVRLAKTEATATADELRTVRDELRTLAHAKAERVASRELANTRSSDATRMLTIVLERMPQNAVDLQRLQARRTALQKQRDVAVAEATRADEEFATAAALRGRAEQLATDAKATATVLAEIEGQLARLHPVVVRLLKSAP